MTLPQKIELYANGTEGKRAVEDLAHITSAILDNIAEGRDEEALTSAIVEQSLVSLLSEFDAEIGKHKTMRRFLDTSIFTYFDTNADYATATVGTVVGEQLVLARPIPYAVLRLRRLVFESDSALNDATIRIINGTTITTITADIVEGLNRIDLDHSLDCDTAPVSVTVGIVSDGSIGLRPIMDTQLPGIIQRGTTAGVCVQSQWELIVDMRKLADDYADELEEAFWYKCGITVLNWHLKSQVANRSTIVGREEIAMNKTELMEVYKVLLCNAVKKIVEVLEKKPVLRNDIRFDRAYSVGSLV